MTKTTQGRLFETFHAVDRYIAHKLHGDHVVRAIYEYHDDYPAVVTVYFPYAGRYYQGGSRYEDNILK